MAKMPPNTPSNQTSCVKRVSVPKLSKKRFTFRRASGRAVEKVYECWSLNSVIVKRDVVPFRLTSFPTAPSLNAPSSDADCKPLSQRCHSETFVHTLQTSSGLAFVVVLCQKWRGLGADGCGVIVLVGVGEKECFVNSSSPKTTTMHELNT